ncbi:MAG: betaine/proline/choline family ABC transporter ATP-binding protein [Dehalococcoidia bacterium]
MIKLDRVSKVYPDGTRAVTEVSLEVADGKLCVLLGPSGCGKTTTMKMINRIIPISEGHIYIDGRDNTELNEDELRRSIGYAIQDIGLFPHMTVQQNIETVPVLKHWPKAKRVERAEELLELMGMPPGEFKDKYPSELSGGQRQRVGVARCLGADPSLLLMDEPFGAIDPITRVRLQGEFLRIQEVLKKTIIFVTHDIYEAIKMGDKIALMNEGRLVQYGTPAELLYRPENEFVEDFVGADRALKGLQLLRVKEIMTDSAPTAKPDENAGAVRARMEREGVDWLAVVDDDGRLLGRVNTCDLGRAESAKEVMSPSATTPVDAVLNEAISLMLGSGLNSLAVVDRDNRLMGMLNFDAIREALVKIGQGGEGE